MLWYRKCVSRSLLASFFTVCLCGFEHVSVPACALPLPHESGFDARSAQFAARAIDESCVSMHIYLLWQVLTPWQWTTLDSADSSPSCISA